MERTNWIRVRRGRACKICEKESWCSISEDGAVARCMRAENGHPSPGKDGSIGYIWQLKERIDVEELIRHEKKAAPERLDQSQIDELHGSMCRHPEAERKRTEEAEALGVRLKVLKELEVGVGWSDRGEEFSSWPSRNGLGQVVGIVRRFKGGKKLTYPGTSNSGLFMPQHWWHRMGPIFLVEGGSDTAALTDANLVAIGRPSNLGGAQFLVEQMRRHGVENRPVLVVCEEDEKDVSKIPARLNHDDLHCRGCLMCWPGYYGAVKVAEQINRLFKADQARVVFPPMGYKDVQEMWGATTNPSVRRAQAEGWLDNDQRGLGILHLTGFEVPL